MIELHSGGFCMNELDLLEVSKQLDEIIKKTPAIINFHHYRYHKFIESSPLGFDCKFAKATKMYSSEEKQSIIEFLDDLIEKISQVRNKINE